MFKFQEGSEQPCFTGGMSAATGLLGNPGLLLENWRRWLGGGGLIPKAKETSSI